MSIRYEYESAALNNCHRPISQILSSHRVIIAADAMFIFSQNYGNHAPSAPLPSLANTPGQNRKRIQ
jgi:hypothetical protein